ncbi:hypothetical protein AAL_04757 [Moelleriella libera RCEF 2490]|uniref:Uncharacterized protein n=1 Tax=Moelleriella libera RCEF 2490 TaxID=1081109 RepID=A0A168BND1_9HYPO|nr:hypothetical protein AAL_04757 [Moelleriella libera RCEF 2490]
MSPQTANAARRFYLNFARLLSILQQRKRDGVLVSTLTRVAAEAALYKAWLRASREGTGYKWSLMRSKSSCRRYSAAVLAVPTRRSWGLRTGFFEDILAVSETRLISVSLLEAALHQADAGSHQARLRLFQWIFSYSSVSSNFEEPSAGAILLLRLETILYTCSETENSQDLSHSIEDLATKIGVLAMGQTTEVDLSVMGISHLPLILGVTGKQKDYKTFKQISDLLWNWREKYDFNLTPMAPVSIGKRLAEVHFACGEHFQAFALLEDITHNLKKVFGVSDPKTLRCQRLLASMHESLGRRRSAIGVRFGMLKDAAMCPERARRRSMMSARSLRREYATTEEFSWHLEQNKDAVKNIIKKVKELVGNKAAAGHDVDDVLDIGRWKGLEHLEFDDAVFESWRALDDWMVKIEMET